MGFIKRKKYMLQTYGNESLKKISERVTVFDRDLVELAKYMTAEAHRDIQNPLIRNIMLHLVILLIVYILLLTDLQPLIHLLQQLLLKV